MASLCHVLMIHKIMSFQLSAVEDLYESANECSDYHYNIVIIFIMISFIVGLQFYAMVTLL